MRQLLIWTAALGVAALFVVGTWPKHDPEPAKPAAPVAAPNSTVTKPATAKAEARKRAEPISASGGAVIGQAGGLCDQGCCMESPSPAGGRVMGLWGSGAGDIWAVGDNTRHFDGKTWTAETGLWRGVHGCSATDVWRVGPRGVERWEGNRWTSVASDAGSAVWCRAPNDVWVGADHGQLRHFDGKAWRTTRVAAAHEIWSFSAFSPTDAWAAGSSATLLHFDGKSWTSRATPAMRDARNFPKPDGELAQAIMATIPDDIKYAVFAFVSVSGESAVQVAGKTLVRLRLLPLVRHRDPTRAVGASSSSARNCWW